MNEGWIKLHRSLLVWEWYSDINTMRLFIHLILKANHKVMKYRGVLINPGQIMTGLGKLAIETGLTVQMIRTSINRLKSTNEITIKTSPQGSIIQLVNYCKYQSSTNDQQTTNKQQTNDQQTNNKQLTTNKKEKNDKNVKKEKNIIPPLLEMIEIYGKERGNKIDINKFFNHYESNGWLVGKNKMKDWQAAYRTWEPKIKKELSRSERFVR